MSEKKYLYRDTENQKIFGVAKGLADYFDLDVTLVRVIWLVLLLCVGTGLLAYLIMAIVVEPKNVVMARVQKEKQQAAEESGDPFSKYDK
ncbi:MAG: PspC domain-containing protein [Candidatus Izemoplasmatales bacterium]|jgi:phage shock protein PspC (stress-responsive transcriptional regulator)|nr:PspC domain-containing protein [Candidatus Izemoplasmatales bacterium]